MHNWDFKIILGLGASAAVEDATGFYGNVKQRDGINCHYNRQADRQIGRMLPTLIFFFADFTPKIHFRHIFTEDLFPGFAPKIHFRHIFTEDLFPGFKDCLFS